MSDEKGIFERIFSNDSGKEIQKVEDKVTIQVKAPIIFPEGLPSTVWGSRRQNHRADLYRELIEIATETYRAKEKLQRAKRRNEKMGDILEGVDMEVSAELEMQKIRIENEMNAAELLRDDLRIERLKKKKELEHLERKEEVLDDNQKRKKELAKIKDDFEFDALKADTVRKMSKALVGKRDTELREHIAEVKEAEGRVLVIAEMEDWPEDDLRVAQEIIDYYEDQRVRHIAKAK